MNKDKETKPKEAPKKEKTQKVPVTDRKIETFNQADLIVECGCGAVHVLDTNVRGGLQIIMPTDDGHSINLVCEKCGAKLTLKFVEAANPEPEEVEEDKPDLDDVPEGGLPEVVDVEDDAKADMEMMAETTNEERVEENEPKEESK